MKLKLGETIWYIPEAKQNYCTDDGLMYTFTESELKKMGAVPVQDDECKCIPPGKNHLFRNSNCPVHSSEVNLPEKIESMGEWDAFVLKDKINEIINYLSANK